MSNQMLWLADVHPDAPHVDAILKIFNRLTGIPLTGDSAVQCHPTGEWAWRLDVRRMTRAEHLALVSHWADVNGTSIADEAGRAEEDGSWLSVAAIQAVYIVADVAQ